ncbi:MAG: sigma-70 family RNA polymerase sigma factor, partial [Pseudonocardiales bacterium]|nr:sigma-70 family RNA polymerase sigma factor [Pseudonocardiales bacterium]
MTPPGRAPSVNDIRQAQAANQAARRPPTPPPPDPAVLATGALPPSTPDTLATATEDDDEEYAHLIPLQRRYAQLATGDPVRPPLRDQLIRGYLPVAEHLARRYAGRGEPLDDLRQIATVGLINAIDRFEPDRGSHFLAFAVPTITGELRRYFRDHGWSTQVPRRLKDLHLAIRSAQAELSQQRDHPPRPSDIADHLAVSTTEVIAALHAAEAYKSSSLDEMLHDGQATPAAEKCLGTPDIQINLVDDRETLRPTVQLMVAVMGCWSVRARRLWRIVLARPGGRSVRPQQCGRCECSALCASLGRANYGTMCCGFRCPAARLSAFGPPRALWWVDFPSSVKRGEGRFRSGRFCRWPVASAGRLSGGRQIRYGHRAGPIPTGKRPPQPLDAARA